MTSLYTLRRHLQRSAYLPADVVTGLVASTVARLDLSDCNNAAPACCMTDLHGQRRLLYLVSSSCINENDKRLCIVQTDPLHKFYTSLREQRPDSEMAKKWYVMQVSAAHSLLAAVLFASADYSYAPAADKELESLLSTFWPTCLAALCVLHKLALHISIASQACFVNYGRCLTPRCLIHGLLDLEEAEQLVAHLKLKKGQIRYVVKSH